MRLVYSERELFSLPQLSDYLSSEPQNHRRLGFNQEHFPVQFSFRSIFSLNLFMFVCKLRQSNILFRKIIV